MAAIPTYCMEGNEINAGGKGSNWTKAYKAINYYSAIKFFWPENPKISQNVNQG